MGDRIHALAKQLTGKERLEECSIDELRHMINRHPYFAPAQFLFLQKLRQAGLPDEADAQYRKAVLYYHDPLLFEQFIASSKFYTEELQNETVAGNVIQEEESIEAETKITDRGEEVGDNRDHVDEIILTEDITTEAFPPPDFLDEVEQPVSTSYPNTAISQRTETFTDEQLTPEISNDHLQPTEIAIQTNEQAENEQIEVSNLTTTSAAAAETKVTSNQELTFEPYHTVDYFASQGIKISQEELPKDKLGKQLKSFTEWLKTMKRLPAAQASQAVESSAEKKVETLADRSVSESDVVTEAMAEVWLKQGNTSKALDIYNKLSLHNPSKKAYFAAKIENLKQS